MPGAYAHSTWWEAYTYAMVKASETGYRYRAFASRARPGRWLVARVLPIRRIVQR